MNRRSADRSRWRRSLLLLSAGALAATALIAPLPAAAATANPVPGDPLTGNGAVSRILLPYSQLTTAQNPSAPVDDAAFALPAAAAPPQFTFEGTLTLTNPAGERRVQEHQELYRLRQAPAADQPRPRPERQLPDPGGPGPDDHRRHAVGLDVQPHRRAGARVVGER